MKFSVTKVDTFQNAAAFKQSPFTQENYLQVEERLKNIRDKINSNLDKLLYEKYKNYLSYYKETVINEYKKYYN